MLLAKIGCRYSRERAKHCGKHCPTLPNFANFCKLCQYSLHNLKVCWKLRALKRRSYTGRSVSSSPPLPADLSGPLHRSIGQTLQGSFSAVSKPNFARKYAFESSRLQKLFKKNAKILQNFSENLGNFFTKNEIAELCKGMHCVDLGESFLLFEPDSYSNAYVLAKFGFDTAENEPSKVWPIS